MEKVVFSDEKKFNLDGPDACQRYWADKRSERQTRKSRNFGGGSLMIWAAFSYTGRSPICIISTKMTSNKYVELLDDVLITFGDDYMPEDWIFQQDNASIHSAKTTKKILSERNIPMLDWPACSPYLNPIENVWGLLAQRVFANGRQFDTVLELKNVVKLEWSKIDETTLKRYIDSMPRRLQQVIMKNGGNTTY